MAAIQTSSSPRQLNRSSPLRNSTQSSTSLGPIQPGTFSYPSFSFGTPAFQAQAASPSAIYNGQQAVAYPISLGRPSPSTTPTPATRHQRSGSTDTLSLQPSMTEWSWFGVDVPITGLAAFKEKLEETNHAGRDLGYPADSDSNEFMSCTFGGDRWQFGIVHRTPELGQPNLKHLSLYVCCNALDIDYASGDVVIPTTIMACVREPTSNRTLIWQTWEEHVFGNSSEYWECLAFPHPSLLLQNPKVASADSAVLSIQIQSPIQGTMPHIQNAKQVPRSLLSGVSAMLDDKKTGDVQFIVYERKIPDIPTIGDISTLSLADSSNVPLYRKRTIYAHSKLLQSRASYFDAMLGEGQWAETESGKAIVKITEFDFHTIYWLLSWIYTDELTFSDNEPLDQSTFEDFGQTLLGRISPGYEWQKLPFGSECGSNDSRATLSARSDVSENRQPARAATSLGYVRPTASTSRLPSSTDRNSSNSRKSVPDTHGSTDKTMLPVPKTSPMQRTATKQHSRNEDPHPHPASVTTPVSALQMYKAGHRYSLPELTRLALNHIISSLTPESAMPLLLATSVYAEVHELIQLYVIANYAEVGASQEFHRCFQEVGSGVWGEQGGEVLYDLVRRLTPSLRRDVAP